MSPPIHRGVRGDQDSDTRLLLVADQFEELYTLCRDTQERQLFLDRLLKAAHHSQNFTLVITLRADFLGQALSYRPFADALQYADLKLGPMNRLEMQEAIEKPAARLGVTLEEGLTERLLDAVSTQAGDRSPIARVSFSPDGKLLAASFGNTLKLWNLDRWKSRTFKGHIGIVTSFSPDGKMLASANGSTNGDTNATVKLWSLGGMEPTTLTAGSGVSFSPDSKTIVIASLRGKTKTVELRSLNGTLLKTLKGHSTCDYNNPDTVRGKVSFSPDGKTIASLKDKTVELRSLNGTLLKTFKGHSTCVAAVSYSPNGQMLTSASRDGTVKLWSLDGTLLKTLTWPKTLKGRTNIWPDDLSFSPDGKIVTEDSVATTLVWSIDGTFLKTFIPL